MKKILTLFAMLLVTVSMLMAQSPKLSYQMVVRDQDNNLVVKTHVTGTLYILQNGLQPAAVLAQPIDTTTNHNGMLSIDITDQPTATRKLTGDNSIDWTQAKIVVKIDAYSINDTMEVLPVPYALNALKMDYKLTTDEIIRYIGRSGSEDVDKIMNAYHENEFGLEDYVVRYAVDYIKNHKTHVKNLILHYLSQTNPQDVQDAYEHVLANQELVTWINNYIIEFAKNHRAEAKEVLLSYIEGTTPDEVEGILSAVDENTMKDITDWMVAKVIAYVKDHRDVAEDLAKYAWDHATVAKVNQVNEYVSTHNTDVSGRAWAIVDSLIQDYLTEHHYLNNAECLGYDICSLLDKIEALENSDFITCPVLAKMDTTRVEYATTPTKIYKYTLKNRISNNTFDVNISDNLDSLVYILSYPGTQSKPDTIQATRILVEGDTSMNLEINFADQYIEKGQKIDVFAMFKARCMPSPQRSDTIHFVFDMECPTVTKFENSDPIAYTDLYKYSGVQLTATIDFNYPEKVAGGNYPYGFVLSTDSNEIKTITNLSSLTNITNITNVEHVAQVLVPEKGIDATTNTFVDTLDLRFCAREVFMKAFIGCKGENDQVTYYFTDMKTIDSVRGPYAVLTATNRVFRPFDDADTLVVRGKFNTNQDGKQDLQYYIDKYASDPAAADYAIEDLTYWWGVTSDTTHKGDTLIINRILQDTVCTGNVSIKMFGATCTVRDTIQIKFQPFNCGDTILVNNDSLFNPMVSILPDAQHASDTTCKGTKDEIALIANSKMTYNGIDSTLKAMKENQAFDGLIQNYSYAWLEYGTGNLLGNVSTNKDTFKTKINCDTMFVCRVDIVFKGNKSCSKYDTILVHYQFRCGDAVKDNDSPRHEYATIEVGGYCWTKSNMRSKYNTKSGKPIVLGATSATTEISNGEAKYYDPSSDLHPTFNDEQLGLLYNHAAADSVCPAGWHLPTEADWHYLEVYVDANGGAGFTETRTTNASNIAANGWGFQHTGPIWFDAYPAGARHTHTLIPQTGIYGYALATFWSHDASPINNDKQYYCRALYFDPIHPNDYVVRDTADQKLGFSVRCVNDKVQACETSIGTTTTELIPTNGNVKITTKINNYDANLIASGQYKLSIVAGGDAKTIDTKNAELNPADSTMSFTMSLELVQNNLTKEKLKQNLPANFTSGSVYFVVEPSVIFSQECSGFTSVKGNPVDLGQVVVDYDTNVYPVVTIGEQTWMAENMRCSKDNVGTDFTTGVYTNPNYANEKYGMLYNNTNAKKVCPTGWSLPDAGDFEVLASNVQECQNEGTFAKALCAKTGWKVSETTCAPGNNLDANNASGFNALPVGYYYYQNNEFKAYGDGAPFWCNPPQNSNSTNYRYYITKDNAGWADGPVNDNDGLGVRCIKN